MRSEEFCNSDQLGSTSSTGQRIESNCILGRFPFRQPNEESASGTIRDSHQRARVIGLDHKLCKIGTKTYSRNRVLRHSVEHKSQFQAPTCEKDPIDQVQRESSSSEEETISKRYPNYFGHDEFRQLCHPQRAVTLSPTATTCSYLVQPSSNQTGEYNCISGCGSPEVERYIRKPSSKERLAPESVVTFSDNGCSGFRMGGADGRLNDIGRVASRPTQLALQSKRNVRHRGGSKSLRTSTTRETSGITDGQSDGSILYQEGGRNAVDSPTQPNISTYEGLGQKGKHIDHGRISARQIQRHRRRIISGQKGIGVALETDCIEESIQEIRNTTDRPFRHQPIESSERLCQQRLLGLISNILQCLQSGVELSTGVGVSATEFDTPSTSSFELSTRNVPPCGPDVGQSVLVARPTEKSIEQTNENHGHGTGLDRSDHRGSSSSGTGNAAFCLENWGWGQETQAWSESERALLRKSWRESTLRTYTPAWIRWVKWCKENNFDYRCPDGNILAKFLAFLFLEESLAYPTILLHKSVVTTFSQTKNKENLNSHFLVKHILKAISLQSPRAGKSPIWDPSDLIVWLQNNVPNRVTLFEASRRLACILLLASGRRVHDLTLLKISLGHFIDGNDHIIFYPEFGSKTDTATHRQSGWKLLQHPNKNVCPVYWSKTLLELSAHRRVDQSLDYLFITVKGEARAASRTIIGNWIKSVLKDANIKASSGGVRSAVGRSVFELV